MYNRKEMQEAITKETAAGNPFYVYGLVRGDTGEVFYVGKGSNGRAFHHEQHSRKGQNPHKEHVIRKHGISGYVLFNSFTNQDDAFECEKETITQIGFDTLTNAIHGGGGADIQKLSDISKTHWENPEFRAKMESIARCPEIREKRRKDALKRLEDPDFREWWASINVGRVWDQEAIDARSEGLKKHWEDEDARARHSAVLSEVCSTPELRKVKSDVSKAHWDSMTEEERAADRMAKRELGATPDFKNKVSDAAKRMWDEADEEKRERMVAAMREGFTRRQEERKARGEYKGPYVRQYETDAERYAAMSARQKEIAADPEEKKRRSVRAKRVMSDPIAKQKVAEGRKRQAAIIREQRKAYCNLYNITSPGKNFCNIDKAHFEKWVTSLPTQK